MELGNKREEGHLQLGFQSSQISEFFAFEWKEKNDRVKPTFLIVSAVIQLLQMTSSRSYPGYGTKLNVMRFLLL
jgi:hypothetical protein